MTTPLIEAMATALYDRDADAAGPDWIEYGGKVRERYREIAQAALTAITEAGYEVVHKNYRGDGAYDAAMNDKFRAMISAAQGDGE